MELVFDPAVSTAQANDRYPVLLVGNFLSASRGTRSACEDLAVRLSSAGWPVVTTSSKTGRLARLADMIGTTWRRRHEYAVAHVDVYSGPSFIWAEVVCWVLRAAHKPYVLTLRGGNLPHLAARSPERVRLLLRPAAVVTTPSGYLFDHMKPYRPALRVLPNAIDIRRYPFGLRRQPRPRLVWLRAFHSLYNPTLAPRVVALLSEDFPDVNLTMVGPDKGDGSLENTQEVAAELAVSNRMGIVGPVRKADVADWLNRSDIFLNTTNVDNTPISVLEAMACGLCVVSTNVGGIPHLLRHEHDALVVPPRDPQAMADAVRRVLTNYALAEALSRSALEKAIIHDWSTVLPQWQAILSAVAQGDRL